MDSISVVNSENSSYAGRIYCPHCGVQVSQRDSRFCRACGADLKLVSEAIARQVTSRGSFRTRLYNFFLNKREYDEHIVYREGVAQLLLAGVSLPLSIWSLLVRQHRPVFWGAFLILSLVCLMIGIANIRAYKRYLQGDSPADIRPHKGKFIVLEIDEKHSQSNELVEQTNPAGRLSVAERITALFDDEPSMTK